MPQPLQLHIFQFPGINIFHRHLQSIHTQTHVHPLFTHTVLAIAQSSGISDAGWASKSLEYIYADWIWERMSSLWKKKNKWDERLQSFQCFKETNLSWLRMDPHFHVEEDMRARERTQSWGHLGSLWAPYLKFVSDIWLNSSPTQSLGLQPHKEFHESTHSFI